MDGQAGKLDLRWMYRDFFSFLFFSFYSWLLKSKRLFSLLPFLTCSSLLLVVVGCFLPLVHLIPNRQTDRQTDRRATAVAGLGYIVSSTSLHTYIHTHTPPYVNVCCLHIYIHISMLEPAGCCWLVLCWLATYLLDAVSPRYARTHARVLPSHSARCVPYVEERGKAFF
ncbi:hypothetical protein IWX49DRAFT_234732 [Phyllosticta citricarpa]